MFTRKITVEFAIKDEPIPSTTGGLKKKTTAIVASAVPPSSSLHTQQVDLRPTSSSLVRMDSQQKVAHNIEASSSSANDRLGYGVPEIGIAEVSPNTHHRNRLGSGTTTKASPSLPNTQRLNRPKSATNNLRKIEQSVPKEMPRWQSSGEKCNTYYLTMELDEEISKQRTQALIKANKDRPLSVVQPASQPLIRSPTTGNSSLRLRERLDAKTSGPILNSDFAATAHHYHQQHTQSLHEQRWNTQTRDFPEDDRYLPSHPPKTQKTHEAFQTVFNGHTKLPDGRISKERSLTTIS